MRRFSTNSDAFKERSWRQLESPPCIYRLEGGDIVTGIASFHVEDIFRAGSTERRQGFRRILSKFDHTEAEFLSEARKIA